MSVTRETLETQLNAFDPVRRRAALEELLAWVEQGRITWAAPRPVVNLHCHTSYSYNGYGYSPTAIAWRARCEGLAMAGIVDFDVLDAVDEFLEVCRLIGLKGCAGLETRIFVPEFATRVINSPGEPGIDYHMGVGFTSSTVDDPTFLNSMKDAARRRTEQIVERVNAFLKPVCLDFERDVLPLTPNGNATERHVCMGYEAKAAECFPAPMERAGFWAEKLKEDFGTIKQLLFDSPTFQGLLRSKTMKAGGAGYVRPEGSAFPRMAEVNALTLAAGAIPTHAWLDGTTTGEQSVEELLDLGMADGVAALNIIPDRNWNIKDPELRTTKVRNLCKIVEVAQARDLPIVVGTEMNAYGQKFVDDFDVPEMQPLAPVFLAGAHIVYAHTELQACAGMGYLSSWAQRQFESIKAKNAFYQQLGERLTPATRSCLVGLTASATPGEVLAWVASAI